MTNAGRLVGEGENKDQNLGRNGSSVYKHEVSL